MAGTRLIFVKFLLVQEILKVLVVKTATIGYEIKQKSHRNNVDSHVKGREVSFAIFVSFVVNDDAMEEKYDYYHKVSGKNFWH